MPAKRHSASFELLGRPGRPSFEALQHAAEGQQRWSIASRSESQASEDDTPMLQQPPVGSTEHAKQASMPAATPSNTLQQSEGIVEAQQALGPSSFGKDDRRHRRAARRSEAIDRAFAQAMSDSNGQDFLPRVLEERSTLFGNSGRRSSPQHSV